MRLTNTQIRRLGKAPKRYTLGDGGGLQLTVYRGGRRSWVYRRSVAGHVETSTLGRWPVMSLDAARRRKAELDQVASSGISIVEHLRAERTKARARVTVREFGKRWMAEVVQSARKIPWVVERYLERDVYPAIGLRPMGSVTGQELQRLIFARRDEGHPEAAAALRYLLKRLFDYAMVCGVATANPTDLTPLRYVTRHRSRSRTLSETELRVFLQRVPSLGRYGVMAELILLTLCRKSELRLARWDHINFERSIWELPPELSKMGTAHIVYLSRQAQILLRRLKEMAGRAEMVLPARDSLTQAMTPSALNKAMARVKWGIPHFTPHDLRRTGSTILNELGYNPDWIEKALNHTPAGVRGVYNRAQYGEQRKQMLQAWADWLEERK